MEFNVKRYSYTQITNALWQECDDFCSAHSILPFYSTRWLRSCVDSEYSENQLYLIVARTDSGDVAAILPFSIRKKFFFSVLYAASCSSWSSWMPMWLITGHNLTPSNKQQLNKLCFESLPDWTVLVTGRMEQEHAAYFEQALPNHRIKYNSDQHEIAEVHAENFETFLASVSGKWRKPYIKQLKKMEKNALEIEHHHRADRQQFLAILDRIMSIYNSSWKTNIKDPNNNLTLKRVYDRFCRLLSAYNEINGLHVMFVTKNGSDIAYYVGLHENGIYCSLETSYCSSHANIRPGALLQMENFRHTIENGYSSNTLMANQQYKHDITQKVSTHIRYFAYTNSMLGQSIRILEDIQKTTRQLKHRVIGSRLWNKLRQGRQ